MTDEGVRPVASPGGGGVGSGRISRVSGGQVAVGGKVLQIDAHGGAQVVVNDATPVNVTRRPTPILRPPPPLPGIVGRDRELARVRAGLVAGRSVEVVGPNGIGKTALLRAAANTMLPPTVPDGVVGVPARLGVGDTLNYLFDACFEGTRRMVPRREELASALAQLRLLVVLDDPDADRDALDELRTSLPGSLLLLSAHEPRIYRDVDGIVLTGLSVEDSVALVAGAVGRDLTGRERDVGRRVAEVLQGVPLELVRFASLVRAEPDADLVAVARRFGVDAKAADVLVAVRRGTSEDEDAVLVALGAFGARVGAGLVAAMSGRRDAGELLLDLASRGLVGGDDLQGWWSRDEREVAPEDRRRAAMVLTTWIRGRTVPEEVAAEIPAIAAVLAACAAEHSWVHVIGLAAAAERPLALASRWSAWETVLQDGLRAARHEGDTASERFFAHQLDMMNTALEIPPVPAPSSTPAPHRPPAPTPRPSRHLDEPRRPQGSPRRPPGTRPPPARPRSRGPWAAVFAVVVVVALVAGGAWLVRELVSGLQTISPGPVSSQPADPGGDTSGTCTVPDLVGIPAEVAASRAFEAGLDVDLRPVDSDSPFGQVLSQSVPAGTQTSCTTVIVLEFAR
jgi:hypothetical protein